MDFNYRWKNGARPSRDEAIRHKYLLDESQFENEQDRQLAEESARRLLNVPLPTADEDKSVLPKADPERKM
ncbi:bromodomain-containing protein [Nostoc sp. FACHB-110]|uniref:bromodomain-containing protein n=1 Tax=Nostoc sp. FACHB-110 TaxID=2692834 RepID=UPI00168436CC|nr:bromodomain-containing protein [Nostoc sp. FACHB-110]MBD2436859.1 bromodomain-containing protein [Nostoc sp. FACHB-110]